MGRSTARYEASDNTNKSSQMHSSEAQSHTLGDVRLIILNGDVTEDSISMIVGQMLHLASVNHDPINLIISTYGGSVDEMFALYDTIKFLPCPVHTVAIGKVMSAGVLLLAAGKKGKRMIGKSARIMIHPVSGGALGNVFQMVNDASEHNRLQNQMVDAIVRESKASKDQLLKIMKTGHDVYILPEEALRLGLVDKIMGDIVK